MPWQPGLAVLQCDIHVEGEPWPYAPRLILKGMLEKAQQRGLEYKVGCEAEYFLVRRVEAGGIEVADPLDRSDAPCYDAKGLTRMFDHLTTLSKYMNRLGWANYANDHEDANGQFEQNFAYSDALTSADRLIFFRYMVHTRGASGRLAATFMPKPFANLTGSGLHLHSSLWDAKSGAELFADADDSRGLGLSEMAYHYIGGLIDARPGAGRGHVPDRELLQALRAWARRSPAPPGPRPTRPTAATTAPRCSGCPRAAGWRTGPATARPTRTWPWPPSWPRASTASTAASTRASRTATTCTCCRPRRSRHGASGTLPPTLLHAMDELVADDVLREALGKTPDGDYIDYYAKVKREEFHAWHSVVSDWEVERYLTLF